MSVVRHQIGWLFMLAASSAWGSPNRPPNIVLILVDDLKPTFGSYGAEYVHSPNLDRLAARGVQFNAAYCNQAVCAPSRNNLMLGSRSTSLGIYGLETNFRVAEPNAVTMLQHFMEHGYHTSGVGKVFHIGHGNTDDPASWSEPFHPDKVVDYVLPSSKRGGLTKEEALFANRAGSNSNLPKGPAWERAHVVDDAYADGRIAREGIQRLQRAAKSTPPFFLALGFTKPHLPFCAPERYWALYDDVAFPQAARKSLPAGAPPYAGKGRYGELSQYTPIPSGVAIDNATERELVQGYFAALSYMDAQVGKVLDELDRLELADNTIVVLWGDHGYHLGDHDLWTKHTNYEQANRIPLIFAGPGCGPSGAKTAALAETVDIYPTLCELAGLPKPVGPQPIDGVSLAPVLRDPQASVKDYILHCFPRDSPALKGGRLGRAIRTERYRLVEWKVIGQPASTAEYELYDYVIDPEETRNLVTEQPVILAELQAILATQPEAKPHVRGAKKGTSRGQKPRDGARKPRPAAV